MKTYRLHRRQGRYTSGAGVAGIAVVTDAAGQAFIESRLQRHGRVYTCRANISRHGLDTACAAIARIRAAHMVEAGLIDDGERRRTVHRLTIRLRAALAAQYPEYLRTHRTT